MPQIFYSLNNEILKHVPNNPYLGVQFSSDLKWHTHTSTTSRKELVLLLVSIEGTKETAPRTVDAQPTYPWSDPPLSTTTRQILTDFNGSNARLHASLWVTIAPGNQAASPICSVNWTSPPHRTDVNNNVSLSFISWLRGWYWPY